MRLGLVWIVCCAVWLCACAKQTDPRADEAVADYATLFSLPALSEHELRIWTLNYEAGHVTGYIVRPGEIEKYEGSFRGPPEIMAGRVIVTPVANQLLALIPELRRMRFKKCVRVSDGGQVAMEGTDTGGRFAFAEDNPMPCEGAKLEALNRAFELLDSVR